MNNYNISIPENLQTITVDSILNNIEKTEDKHIYMLKNYIPHKLFELIEKRTLLMCDAMNPAKVNLNRVRKLLPVDLFNKHLNIYLDVIIENDLVNVNLAHVRDNTPEHVYIIFIQSYLEDEKCWEYFVETMLGMPNVLTMLDILPLTWEQYLVLVNTPDSYNYNNDERFDGAYDIVLKLWRLKNEPYDSAYCLNCIEKNQQVVSKIQILYMQGENLARDLLKKNRNWCSKCVRTPLFHILNHDLSFVGIDFIGNYPNS